MSTWTNIGLMIYFTFVSVFGTLGNGIILLAYGNRWSSSRSTSVVFILILACFDLWTCLIVAPTFAIMEYREFEVPTLLCRFYSFSKSLIISSSLIMSFIAMDRFLNIAVPHYRLLNPRRVKLLLTLFLLIGIGLGISIALAFSSAPYRETYLANYNFIQSNDSYIIINAYHEISLTFEQKNVSSDDLIKTVHGLIPLPDGANITNVNLTYLSTYERCFADTSIISETIRDILRHISNKCFFISIGIVTIFYTITFILALHRQNPRIRALKKSLHVLNKFDSHPTNVQSHNNNNNNSTNIRHHRHHSSTQRNDSIGSYLPLYSSIKTKSIEIDSNRLSTNDNQQYEMSSFISNDELDDQNALNTPKQDYCISISEATSDDLQTSIEKFPSTKQVSFQVENNNNNNEQHSSFLNNSFDIDSDQNNDTYYQFPCPCSTTRHLVIKFHFAQPKFDINQWLCYSCFKKRSSSISEQRSSIINPIEDEPSTNLILTSPTHHHISNSEILRKQLHRHRLKQIRMAFMFLLITVSFVLFYLPSILTAERIIKSPIMIYYLFLCTHAFNPIIYCFMNMNLRAYVFSMLKCRTQQKRNFTNATITTNER